jgi:Transcriptional regulatory protein, C terminal
MFLPPVLRPLAAVGPVNSPVRRIAEAPFSVVRGPPGSYLAERLAGVIDSWERLQDCVWLRAPDRRPAELAQSLAVACRHRWSSGAIDVRAAPGPQLSEEIQMAPEGAIIVIELGGRVTTGVTRLVRAIRPAITDRGISVVVVAESRFHRPVGRAPDWVTSAFDLFDGGALDGYSCIWNRAQLLKYVGPRVAVVYDVVAAGQRWSQDVVAEALDASHGLPSFLERLTAVLLDQLTPDQRSALEVASVTGYWHPQLGTRPVAAEQLRPWLVPLERQWGWLRPIWATPLRRELARSAGSWQAVGTARATQAVTLPAAPEACIVPATRTAEHPGLLQARLLGPFEVRLDGTAVTSWNGRRGASVLRYLLSRRLYACSRDELLEEYWPDVPVGAARNRLQVAVSGLRRTLREVTALNVVEIRRLWVPDQPGTPGRGRRRALRTGPARSRRRRTIRSSRRGQDGLPRSGRPLPWRLRRRRALRAMDPAAAGKPAHQAGRRLGPAEPRRVGRPPDRRLHCHGAPDARRRPLLRGRAPPADALLRRPGADLPGTAPV